MENTMTMYQNSGGIILAPTTSSSKRSSSVWAKHSTTMSFSRQFSALGIPNSRMKASAIPCGLNGMPSA